MRSSFSICFHIVFLFVNACFGQEIHFNLVTRSPEDIGGIIWGMTQDTQGFLWLATEHGLYKYDGYQYTSYHHQPLNPNSPTVENIIFVAADKAGYVWLAPRGKGLDRLDPATGAVKHFRHNDSDPGSLASDSFSVILQDHEGAIWIGTWGNGLDKFDGRTNTFIHYSHNAGDPSSISCNEVAAIYEDKQGTIWAGTGSAFRDPNASYNGQGGLNKLNKQTGKFIRYVHDEKDPHGLIDNRVSAIFEDNRGNFWIGTAEDGLHTMNRATGLFERHPYDSLHPDKLSRPPVKKTFPGAVDHITFINEDSRGRIWIGTFAGGINVYDPYTKNVSYYGADKNSKEQLGNNDFCRAYKTKDNVLWISTFGNNLYKIIPHQNILPHIRVGKVVYAFAEDDARTLWIGTEKGLIQEDSNGKIEQILVDKDSSSLANYILYIEKDGSKLWLATAQGLYLFDPVTKIFTRYHHQVNNAGSLLSDTIFALKKDTGNKLWLGCINGLDLMDTKSGTFTHYQHSQKDTGSISNNEVGTIYVDKEQNLWAGTNDGLNRLDAHTGLFKKYLLQLNTWWIMQDKAGVLWAGTSAGLFKYDQGKDDFISFADVSGMLSTSTYVGSITEDQAGNLWFVSNNGIISLNKERNKAVAYGKNQGVNSLAFTYFGYVRQNGEILYADTSGYFTINPRILEQTVVPPFVTISNFLLNNQPVQPAAHGVLSVPLMQTKEIRLDHDQNTFSFEFTNIDFISAHEDIRLLYMLQNYDNAWRKAGDERRAYYFNLPAGNYIFKVKALNAAGMVAEKNIAIIISPPWWNRWWAYGLYALIAGAIFYSFYRNRINQLKSKQAAQINVMVSAQEGERKRIAMDLHDDVGTKLSALKMSLSSLHDNAITANNNEIKMLAENTEQFITEVMQDVRQLLLNLSPTVLEEFGYTVAVEGLVNKINETKQLHFDLVIFGMNQRLRKDYELALYRITQELINNVLKHADAKNVALQIGQRDKKIILMMEDDGNGFDVSAHKDGFGLKNLDARTKLMQGTLTIDSKAGNGTSVLIEIPYNFS